jgi:hypothetical protein
MAVGGAGDAFVANGQRFRQELDRCTVSLSLWRSGACRDRRDYQTIDQDLQEWRAGGAKEERAPIRQILFIALRGTGKDQSTHPTVDRNRSALNKKHRKMRSLPTNTARFCRIRCLLRLRQADAQSLWPYRVSEMSKTLATTRSSTTQVGYRWNCWGTSRTTGWLGPNVDVVARSNANSLRSTHRSWHKQQSTSPARFNLSARSFFTKSDAPAKSGAQSCGHCLWCSNYYYYYYYYNASDRRWRRGRRGWWHRQLYYSNLQ